MRNILSFLCLSVFAINAFGQDMPEVIPPSPEAISMVRYGNTDVSYYSGQPNFSVPLYTISARGIQLPVGLSYSGFQGINVESIAPWVGLGWSLNATFAVSRSIRDLPDDETIKADGYLTIPIPDIDDEVQMQKYLDGVKDKEPDTFYFNINGKSGSFYIDKAGNVLLKSKDNVRIEYSRLNEIDTFIITDTSGFKYVFDQKERSLSVGQGKTPADVPNATTSWYISSIRDQDDNVLVSFNYNTLSDLKHITYSAQSVKPNTTLFQEAQDMRFTYHTTSAKRIKEIIFPTGRVEFQMSENTRQDYLNDRWLKGVKIFDGNGAVIKQFTLNYSYFDYNAANGVSPIDVAPANLQFNGYMAGDYFKRLKLDEVQEWNSDSTASLPPFRFEYELSQKLPSRYSYAKDHWGFYNGQLSNNSPEPNYRFKYIQDLSGLPIGTERTVYLVNLGSANREANEEYAKAGVLTKVVYPSGGYTKFEMEGNVVVDDLLPNQIERQPPLTVSVDGSNSSTFDVVLINEPFTVLTFKGFVGQTCDVAAYVYQTGNPDPIKSINLEYQQGLYSHYGEVFLEPGTGYYVKLNYYGGCTYQNSTDQLEVSYEKEILLAEKKVGGLRVKRIIDHDGVSKANDVVRNFYYRENGLTGLSTGRVASIPQYAQQTIVPSVFFLRERSKYEMNLYGLIRNFSSTYPLISTSGAFVGYKKVTMVNGSEQVTGKSEFEFTTLDEFPVFRDAYLEEPLMGEGVFIFGSEPDDRVESFPFAENDDRDYLRGRLKRQVIYKWNDGGFDTVSVTENEYAFTYNIPQLNGLLIGNVVPWLTVADNGPNYDYVTGFKQYVMPSHPTDNNGTITPWTFKNYRLYMGRMDLMKTTTRQFSTTNPNEYIETTTENFWDDLATQKFQVSRTQITESNGDVLETKVYYPYDYPELQGFDSGDQVVLQNMIDRNITTATIHQEQERNGIKVSVTRTNYKSFAEEDSQWYLPGYVSTARGGGVLEPRVRYHRYDAVGNPIQVSREDGIMIVYIWGYNNSLPVAKIENATYAQIEGLIGLDLGNNGLSAAQESQLRSLPNCLVTTITYRPGVGMTTQTDPNGLTTFYEYDSFGRLKLVRDSDQNIIKAFNYHYKGQ
ncbi:RHS repeat domain-containing protein [Roseivirga sp. UBA838]|uniref:RHS repeat domain-containing protein n=1 Tax=Roseivirga sp. UBA838 TaxID=1947393 RepID=UPI00257F7861|nr:RHS repeat domain-containing protein [Roseivirga sp. UBA838]|tara:strand:- start:5142 stop:8501 length:3360 start_codon:yes stop_codon:yes gene_type:complete